MKETPDMPANRSVQKFGGNISPKKGISALGNVLLQKKVLKHNRLCKLQPLFPDFRSCVPWLHIHPCSTHTLNKAVLT